MHTMRISAKCLVLILLFNLCLVGRVFSRTCYICESSADEPCFDNVNHADFQYDCAKTVTDDPETFRRSSQHLQAFIKEYSTDYKPGNNSNFDCVTITGRRSLDEERIVRGCIPKSKNFSDLESSLISSGFLTDSCERCDADLCNSHPQTKVPRPTMKSKDTESYTEATTVDAELNEDTEGHTKATTIDAKRLSSLYEDTESYAKAATVDAKRLSSLAKVIKFDYWIIFWCSVVLLVSTFFH